MEQDSYYFRVGLFVSLAFLAAVLVIGFFADKSDDAGHTAYAIYFPGSVDGLNGGAPIKLKGLQVGFVKEIGFASEGSDSVRVIAEILDSAPIHANTRASLQLQGITGSSIIALENLPTEKADPLTAKDKDKYPIIISQQSSLEKVFSSVPQLIDQATKLAEQGQKMLSDDNVNAVHDAIASINNTVNTIGKLVGSDKKGLEIHETLEKVSEMIGEAELTLREIKMLAHELREDPSLLIHGVAQGGVKIQ